MKKAISIFLVLITVLSLCACGKGSETGETGETAGAVMEGLHVGYAREKILPETPVPMGGYGNSANRISTGFLDYPYMTCVAFTEDGETVLMISQDLLRSVTAWSNQARELIKNATGVPEDHIMFCATHTHSSPDLGSDDTRIKQYRELYMNAAVKVAQDALADRAPAKLSGAKVKTERMNFVRHYLLSDGSYGGDNFGDFTKNSIVDHATVGDPELILINIQREGEKKKDIALVNFQAHPCKTGGSKETNISADFIGAARDSFEQQTSMLFAYFTGAAGNQNTSSRIPGEALPYDNKEYGAALAKYVIDALPTAEPIEGEGVKTKQLHYQYATHQEGLDKLEQAKEVADLYAKNGDTDEGNALATQYGFHSLFQCRGIVASATRPESGTMELNAVYVAGMAFVTAPYEMFSNTALYIKENSPFKYTVVCSCTTNMTNYFPTKEAFDYGCYESFTAYFAKGCAEDSAQQLVDMLTTFQ